MYFNDFENRFEIEQSTGRVFTISHKPTLELDRESIDTYYMNVDAVDGGGLRTSVQLIIKLEDVNDNKPQFINNLFSLDSLTTNSTHTLIGFIEENQSNWFEPIRLQAFDRDIGMNGLIEYTIASDEGDIFFRDLFIVDSYTKSIALKHNTTLDFEQIFTLKKNKTNQSKTDDKVILDPGEIDINLVVIARDFGSPSLSSKINARIIVKDVNDNKPKFEKFTYYIEVPETAKFGSLSEKNYKYFSKII